MYPQGHSIFCIAVSSTRNNFLPATVQREVRQGKGKGNVEYWVALVQPGKVLYEIQGVTREVAQEAFKLAAAKLCVKTEFVERTVM